MRCYKECPRPGADVCAWLDVFSASCKPLTAPCLLKAELNHLLETFQKWLLCLVEQESQMKLHLDHPDVALTTLNPTLKVAHTALGEGRVIKTLQNFPARSVVQCFAKLWLFWEHSTFISPSCGTHSCVLPNCPHSLLGYLHFFCDCDPSV